MDLRIGVLSHTVMQHKFHEKDSTGDYSNVPGNIQELVVPIHHLYHLIWSIVYIPLSNLLNSPSLALLVIDELIEWGTFPNMPWLVLQWFLKEGS